MPRLGLILLVISFVWSATALAAPVPQAALPPEVPSPARRGVGLATAVVPGSVVHGLGHMALGQWRTGRLLLLTQGLGLAAMVAGIGAHAATGATRRAAGVFTGTIVAGFGAFSTSWLADIYGVAASGTRGAGVPVRRSARWVGGLDLIALRTTRDAPAQLLRPTVGFRRGAWRADALVELGRDDALWRAVVTRRLRGPTPERPAVDGSYLEVRGAAQTHHQGSAGVRLSTAELEVAGRLDLHRVGPSLRGAFVEAGGGIAGGITSWSGGRSIPPEWDSLLLARFAFGLYLGHDRRGWSELRMIYDHRHDGHLGGAKLPGLGSGNGGSLQGELRLALSPRLGLRAWAGMGSAWAASLGLLFRLGGHR